MSRKMFSQTVFFSVSFIVTPACKIGKIFFGSRGKKNYIRSSSSLNLTIMSHSRRTFLKNSALAVTAASFLPGKTWAALMKDGVIGVQLYSVRDYMHKDPSGTLKKLADMGYIYVEHANYVDGKFYGYAPKDFRALLDGLGLKMHSGHTAFGPGG